MNHPNLPVINWVYHTRPSFFNDRVNYDAKREFHYVLQNPPLPEVEQEKLALVEEAKAKAPVLKRRQSIYEKLKMTLGQAKEEKEKK